MESGNWGEGLTDETHEIYEVLMAEIRGKYESGS
jgi:hypothetical protein